MMTPFKLYQGLYNRLTLKAHRGSIGIGLIGVGGWGAANARNIMRCRRFNICGVYDKHLQFANRFASRYGTQCFEQMDEMLDADDIQVIAATVPNHFHAEVVKAAADAGKHVFIEKPLASSSDLCRELGEYCRDKGVILQVGHQVYREPVYCEMKRIIDSGGMGRPLYAQAVYALARRTRDDWRQDATSCPGGSMEQLGVHLIDVLIHFFGVPLKTKGWAENIPRTSDKADWGSVLMSFDHNVTASISTSFSSPSHMRLDVFFEGGNLSTNGETLWITRAGTKGRKVKPRGLAGGVSQFMEFADCIELGNDPEIGALQAAAVMDVVRSIYCEKEI
ncbi:Gfo/Idh/MocA family protein [Desulfoluna spongiiphila]|uniref:Gfo/Idh/MocA family protein n=1 Tax=Desulfoluna spongiiphila TaxID=419481 RepID=UPI001258F075|nr:Gfo/Idh/MocA family oxidoreductase [Desulfoluna spongiiphila]VVS94863.1 oxidoreductase n-terminal [Desulfoluna spongiiphila]